MIFYLQLHSFPEELLNKQDLNEMPPHILHLKVGAPIMLMRNLDQKRGHCNGTRYIIKALKSKVIFAEIVVGPYKGSV